VEPKPAAWLSADVERDEIPQEGPPIRKDDFLTLYRLTLANDLLDAGECIIGANLRRLDDLEGALPHELVGRLFQAKGFAESRVRELDATLVRHEQDGVVHAGEDAVEALQRGPQHLLRALPLRVSRAMTNAV